MTKKSETLRVLLEAFSQKAKDHSFYIERLVTHTANHKFLTQPHNHDFYLLLYVDEGGGEHTIDFKTYPISPGSFFLMTPGQVHSWNMKEGTNGYIIFFLPSFYQMQAQESNLLTFPFFHSLNANPLVILNHSQKVVVDFVLNQMAEEFIANPETDLRILRSYLEIVLLKISTNFPTQGEEDFANNVTFRLRKLEQLIETHFVDLKQPRQYADLMNLSPSYLNAICKQQLGKTLTDMISERIILEAKRLFSFSDLNVGEVSDKLNFSDSSYFIRFFRKHAGLTPEQFKDAVAGAN
ncbi:MULTISPECIES: AraC family transcriptional regulator [unclassified Imperialibacter]|uniref:helix-turn-helix domain-containing protein n=1 Tax=unclassified Imperialibacter TaxID=2629706 RepID=UPI00125C69AC|nr:MULTISPECIES: AraC family transcriptional regulator [unclassified Imperialibacter]CAD5251112.1 AraC-type DNA-binding protein [Imperialibacter sp. 89]CAD5284024.1 AraC-type DNA-binding protein [Imperialibacter sp. 75]VVT10837.1 AraC-type DNA-binding protein [Imperialibacter sp. EC-SDR9]